MLNQKDNQFYVILVVLLILFLTKENEINKGMNINFGIYKQVYIVLILLIHP